ncbi:outer membrane lipoprotein carrier protein LolA [Kitasatospora sp. NPDC059673]|uniref:LolA family protein n=1 Tax=Kitasatospora sp. NPDC059673 TaxID=3346901 RepID=UPI00369828FF
MDQEATAVQNLTAPRAGRRRTAVRIGVPVAIAAVVATGIGLVPALASDESPNLPAISAQDLIAKALSANTDTFSGTVRVNADLGLPTALTDLASGSGPLGEMARGAGAKTGSADPQMKAVELLGGSHTLSVVSDGPDRQRLTLSGQKSGYELVHNGDQVWAYDRSSQQALHLTGAGTDGHRPDGKEGIGSITPQDIAKQLLEHSSATTSVTVDGTERVAGHAAYKLSIKPKQAGSTVAEIRVSIDAEKGLPLAVQLRTVDGATAFDVRFGTLSYAKPEAKTFEFSVPKGAKVVEQSAKEHAANPMPSVPGLPSLPTGGADGAKAGVIGEGWTAIARGEAGADAAKGIAKFAGREVKGGTLVSTRVVNALITKDGKIYMGAVTPETLEQAAASGK